MKLSETFRQYYISKLAKAGLISRSTKPYIEVNEEQLYTNVYEAGLRGVKGKKYQDVIKIILDELDTKEDEDNILNIIQNNKWEGTEYQINVAKHILIHIFLMIFLTIDDYRTAKYINYIYTNNIKNNERIRIMKQLKGSFLYEWVLELGKILRVYNLENFMLNIANYVLRLIEPSINMNNINMSLPVNFREQISNISDLFEDFISKSLYTKITYVKDLPSCLKITSCDNNDKGCDLYSHGVSSFSKYDQT